MIYNVPFAYEMYGRIPVDAKSLSDAFDKAKDQIKRMSATEMATQAEYLLDSEEIDEEGLVIDENGNIVNE